MPEPRHPDHMLDMHSHSPMAPIPITMPMHPDSPRDGPPLGDKHDGPSGYGPPHSYAPSYPYPYYGAPSYPPPGSYHSYPPPPTHYGNYGPPPYYPPAGGGYGYPSQQPNKPQMSDSKRRKSPSRRNDKDKNESLNATLAEDIEMERMRAAAEPMQVKPMRTEYHFFVDDMRDKIQAEAEKELGENARNKVLLYTNMNARLMKAWEDASEATRADYLVKEEEDRRRFMMDDEIASRHCATLTARARSPRGKEGEDQSEDDSGDSDADGRKRSPGKPHESPPKKVKVDEKDVS